MLGGPKRELAHDNNKLVCLSLSHVYRFVFRIHRRGRLRGLAGEPRIRGTPGPDIAAGELGAERSDPNYRDVILEERPRQALARLNEDLQSEVLEDAFGKLTLVANRNTLLPKLISGELRLTDAEQFVGSLS